MRHTLQDPAVGLTVRHFKPILQQLDDVGTGNEVTLLELLSQVSGHLGFSMSSNEVPQQTLGVDVDEAVFLSQSHCMLLEVSTWWTHHDDSGRLARCLSLFELEQVSHFFNDLHLAHFTVDLHNVAHELLLNSIDADAKLSDCILGYLIKLPVVLVGYSGALLMKLLL